MKTNKIKVRAAEGRRVFFPTRTAAAPGGRNLILSGEDTLEVDPGDRFVAKRIKKGDLLVVKQSQATKPKAKPAGEIKEIEAE